MSFSDRFELLELLRGGEVQTFRARERATGRLLEAHFSAFPEQLVHFVSSDVIDRGSHEGESYVVAASALETAPLGSAGAWRIRPSAAPPAFPPQEPMGEPSSGAAPGDFTRMFQLRQAPAPIAAASKSTPLPVAMSQPGEFTRAFQKPSMAPAETPGDTSASGQPGEFTRMFQKPVPAAAPAPPAASLPMPPAPADQPVTAGTVTLVRLPVVVIVLAIVVISAIAVFVVVRRLY